MVVHTYILKLVNSSNKKKQNIIHLPYEKSIIEQPFSILNKDRTESFDDYFRVERKGAANYNTFPISLIYLLTCITNDYSLRC
jgi:hypothetical protein